MRRRRPILLHADTIVWRWYRSLRLPFRVTVAFGIEWR